ncbi:hypothetical protein E2K98_18015 [Bacillus salipaludis]|uniref:Uncharacterized protein n=1 Tax=Bacillus salipaludis TaxID=2547811 RepID=A0A4R5VNX7_9BACI|nr:hypothetical protein [Bacillus salipaludis]TDK59820.1 hypothetical protein E2K98_18015 [Bacillus salipaludis]
MYWKLRIPLLFLVIGILGGLRDRFPDLFFEGSPIWVRFLFNLLLYLAIFWILEKTKIAEKKIHFAIGILFVLLGMEFKTGLIQK